jgi:superfamily I DNA/RNA helicase
VWYLEVRSRKGRHMPYGRRASFDFGEKKKWQTEAEKYKHVQPIEKMGGSRQQEEYWDTCLRSNKHVVLNALAGTGKTFSIVQAVIRLEEADPSLRIVLLAFNKHIADELNGKLYASGLRSRATTYNSYGFQACKRKYPVAKLVTNRLTYIVRKFHRQDDRESVWSAARSLTRLAKCHMLDEPKVRADVHVVYRDLEQAKEQGKPVNQFLVYEDEELGRAWVETITGIAIRHNVHVNGSVDRVAVIVAQSLAECLKNRETLDFDDQVWWTVKDQMQVPTADILFVDEYQDTNAMQAAMVRLICPSGRIAIVGDMNQAIYGFRGADVNSIPAMVDYLGNTQRGVKELPLTFTRRNPKSHVRLAQRIVPEFEAIENAPEGDVVVMSKERAIQEMRPGDLVLCRTNAPLIPACYALIRDGVRAIIRGRTEMGEGLLALTYKLAATDVSDLLKKLVEYRQEELARLVKEEASGSQVEAMTDKVACLVAVCDGCKELADIEVKIDKIFAEFDDEGRPNDAVVLGTVHRTKGLEADRVFILKPELIPHPLARDSWEQAQELNLAYVAVTRSRDLLVFCGPIPPIYGGEKPQTPESDW